MIDFQTLSQVMPKGVMNPYEVQCLFLSRYLQVEVGRGTRSTRRKIKNRNQMEKNKKERIKLLSLVVLTLQLINYTKCGIRKEVTDF